MASISLFISVVELLFRNWSYKKHSKYHSQNPKSSLHWIDPCPSSLKQVQLFMEKPVKGKSVLSISAT